MSEIEKDLKEVKNFGAAIGMGMLIGAAVLIAGALSLVAAKWMVENWYYVVITMGVVSVIAALAIGEDK